MCLLRNESGSEALEFSLGGEQFLALGSRALHWPSQSTTFVSDVHLGKAASFRFSSIPLPHGTTAVTLQRLASVLKQTGCNRLVVLGDLWHDGRGRSKELTEKLCSFTQSHSSVEFILVSGNHDRKFGATPRETGFREVDRFDGGFICGLHFPTVVEGRYVVSGHIHPGYRLAGGRQSYTAPCFLLGEQCAVLPAFGEFTGTSPIQPQLSDRVVLVAEERVYQIEPTILNPS